MKIAYRITATDPRTSKTEKLAGAATLANAAARLERDAAFWCRHGWDYFTIEHADGRRITLDDAAGNWRLWRRVRGNA